MKSGTLKANKKAMKQQFTASCNVSTINNIQIWVAINGGKDQVTGDYSVQGTILQSYVPSLSLLSLLCSLCLLFNLSPLSQAASSIGVFPAPLIFPPLSGYADGHGWRHVDRPWKRGARSPSSNVQSVGKPEAENRNEKENSVHGKRGSCLE